MKARAAELLRQDQAISQCKSFRGIADKLGVKRFQNALPVTNPPVT